MVASHGFKSKNIAYRRTANAVCGVCPAKIYRLLGTVSFIKSVTLRSVRYPKLNRNIYYYVMEENGNFYRIIYYIS